MRALSFLLSAAVAACGAQQATVPPPITPPSEPKTESPPATTADADATKYPPGLLVDDVKLGTGDECKKSDRITVRYVGLLDDGTQFDAQQSATFQIGVGMLIKGWDEGIPGMRVGGIRNLTIPPSLGYGSKATGKIPAYSTLHFEVELLAIQQ